MRWLISPPVYDAYQYVYANWVVAAILTCGLLFGVYKLRKLWLEKKQLAGEGIQPASHVIKTNLKTVFRQNTYPVFEKGKLAEKTQWLTWVRFAWGILALTVIHFATGITHLENINIWYAVTVLIIILWLSVVKKTRFVNLVRQRTLEQMYSVAAASFRYPSGAEQSKWTWVNITGWSSLYHPDETHIAFPPGYRSEDQTKRVQFQVDFNSTVSDQHIWLYEWESANNRVIAKPAPHITKMAHYPFPATRPWHEIPLGVTVGDEEVCVDLKVVPHMLIAGSTGSGKSVTQRAIMVHALQSPDWRVVGVDLKRVELSPYKKGKNVVEIAVELEDATALLERVEAEMKKRYDQMEVAGVTYFKDLPGDGGGLPAMLVMVDEVYQLLAPEGVKTEEGKETDALKGRCTALIGSIARLGRAAGVHLVLATQRPDAKVIPGETRALALDTRIITQKGWSTVGEVEVGDYVFDENGMTCRVTGTTEVMNDRPCYQVEFSNGERVTVDYGHLWKVRRTGWRGIRDYWTDGTSEKIVTTFELFQNMIRRRGPYVIDVKGLGLELMPRELVGDDSLTLGERFTTGGFTKTKKRKSFYITRVSITSPVPVKCLAVDSPSHLFLVGKGLVPTHNSNLDVRIAMGRMDTTPSLMVLDSADATNIPGIKGRAMVRFSGHTTEFQGYFLDPKYLPQVIEMSNAIVDGLITKEELLEDDTIGNQGEKQKRNWFGWFNKFQPLVTKIKSFTLAKKLKAWYEKRKQLADENEKELYNPDGTPKKTDKQPKSSKNAASVDEKGEHPQPVSDFMEESELLTFEPVGESIDLETDWAQRLNETPEPQTSDPERLPAPEEEQPPTPTPIEDALPKPDLEAITEKYGESVASLVRQAVYTGEPVDAVDLLDAFETELYLLHEDQVAQEQADTTGPSRPRNVRAELGLDGELPDYGDIEMP